MNLCMHRYSYTPIEKELAVSKIMIMYVLLLFYISLYIIPDTEHVMTYTIRSYLFHVAS